MKRLLLSLFFVLTLQAQPPDCTLPINIPTGSTVPFNIGPFDNRTAGCTTWLITYNSITYSALSIIVQTAPNSTGGVPGSWSTFTPVTGSNPNTATTQAVSTFGGVTSYFPWLRVQLTSATGAGTISGRLYGWRIPPATGTSTAVISGTVDVQGTKSNNAGVPGANNLGVLPGIANAAVPTYTEGDQVLESLDLSGRLRVLTTVAANTAVLSGQQTVTASAVALATNTSKNVCVKALNGNSAAVYIGPTGITTSTGFRMDPGDVVCGPISNTNLNFVIAAAAIGDAVTWYSTN